MQTTLFYLKKIADNQCGSITKGSIYHMKRIYIQPHLVKISTMFHICQSAFLPISTGEFIVTV